MDKPRCDLLPCFAALVATAHAEHELRARTPLRRLRRSPATSTTIPVEVTRPPQPEIPSPPSPPISPEVTGAALDASLTADTVVITLEPEVRLADQSDTADPRAEVGAVDATLIGVPRIANWSGRTEDRR